MSAPAFSTHERMRAALLKHGIGEPELVAAAVARGVPAADASMLVSHFVGGDRIAAVVAAAIIDVIVAQSSQTRH